VLRSFPKGGVHPPENKFSAGNKITLLDLPKTVNIPLSQHLGAPAAPVVKRGDLVKQDKSLLNIKALFLVIFIPPSPGKY
jgi:Na+-translocating ferredoxin:NAD+ oxidoreductase RnfC subunit